MTESTNVVKAGEDKKQEVAELFGSKPELPRRDQAEMSREFLRLRSGRICENLAGRASYLYTASRMEELAEMFAKRPDTEILMPYGIYRGTDAARRCFVEDLGDRDDPERREDVTGRMIIRDMCTPILEVSGDGKTARGLWVVPGLEAHPDGQGSAQGYWSWCKIAMDFILDEGTWKIWHYRMYMYFASEYEKDWALSPKFLFTPARVSADEPAPVQYYYTTDGVYPDSEPEPPVPYETWDEVGQ